MKGPPTDFWGKLEGTDAGLQWHPLVDHSADVAACAEVLLLETALGRRQAVLAGVEQWSDEQMARFGVFAALHDVGKFNRGFQGRWRTPSRRGPGHVGPAVALFAADGAEAQQQFIDALDFQSMAAWVDGEDGAARLFLSAVCHHGKPCGLDAGTSMDYAAWTPGDGIDPMDGIRCLVSNCRRWFPAAFAASGATMPDLPALQHAFCGLVTLADWLGSDARRFRFREIGDYDRMAFARATARESLRDLGLAASVVRARLPAGASPFSAVSRHPPRAAQEAVGRLPVSREAALTVLEAETGSGKTEAGLFHFLRLFHAGIVDGMYFALPTRTAATEIHRRVESAVRTMFPHSATRPPVVLAVPGYLKVDDQEGERLAPFEVLWNDDDRERWRFRGWAAENSKRYLAGAISVGTVDQVLLSALAVPHAHMRAVALLRQLLVVDEVHASDTYMTRILVEVLNRHLEAGGHALLLSATLGGSARDAFIRCADRSHVPTALDAALAAPYPVISAASRSGPLATTAVPSDHGGRRTEFFIEPIAEEPVRVAVLALEAAARGARVLVLRNTVGEALATQRALEEAAAAGREALLFRCTDLPAPYHARFAREDRLALDAALLDTLRPPIRRELGVVVVATQTAQQSLDIDADLLVTDLCPADVLLQRLGRLHRHADERRPAGFQVPHAHVLVPGSRDLGQFIRRSGEGRGPCGIGTVYEDLRALEATWRLMEETGCVEVPRDSRLWVERTTHPEALTSLVKELGGAWTDHHASLVGKHSAQRRQAQLQLASWTAVFGTQESLFPGQELDRWIATRLGISDRLARFEWPVSGAFGTTVTELSIPGWMMYDVPDDARPSAVAADGGEICFQMAARPFRYSRLGLERGTSAEDAADVVMDV